MALKGEQGALVSFRARRTGGNGVAAEISGASSNGRRFRHSRRTWEQHFRAGLIVADGLAAIVAGVVAQLLRFGALSQQTAGHGHVSYFVLAFASAGLWLATLAVSGVYDVNVVGTGPEEYRRLVQAAIRLLAVVALLSYVFDASLARGVVLIAVPLAFGFSVAIHYAGWRLLSGLRRRGHCSRRLVVVGKPSDATSLARHLRRVPDSGLRVVSVCCEGSGSSVQVDGRRLPLLSSQRDVVHEVATGAADAVAVMASGQLEPGAVRRLAWELEGTGGDLLVVPSVTDVAGPRLRVHPVGGLPLVQVEGARFSGVARFVKGCVERPIAIVAIVLLSPLLAAIAVLVKLTSPGPVLFRQVRVGRDFRPFTMLKFRTMREGAEVDLSDLADLNEADGLLFKIRRDPRVTPLGHFLRKFSLDELPQLWHVVSGRMSIVGPRPPLPSEVEHYDSDLLRRLLVKPGLTGLWQVSGRTNLSWEDAIRLDLYYIDNWSLALDIVIVFRTLVAILLVRGAY